MSLPLFRCRCGRVVPEIHTWVRRDGTFTSLHCSEHCPGPPPERIVASLTLDLPRRMLVLSAATAEMRDWLNRDDVLEIWRDALEEVGHLKIRPDPRAGEHAPGAGEMTPSLVAILIASRLRAAFPDLAIECWPPAPAPS